MIVKVVGLHHGQYTEQMFDHVEDYVFTNNCGDDVVGDVFAGGDAPYSRLALTFARRDPLIITFNTRAFVMTGDAGKTIDVLHFDSRKE